MTDTLPSDKPTGFEYLSDRAGNPEEFDTPEDAAAYARLRPLFPGNDTCFIAKNGEGIYGFAVEGSEYPFEATKDFVDPDWYDGRAVNGEELPPGEFPSLADIVRHATFEIEEVNKRYDGLGADIYWGGDTFDGHATVLAFVPETSLDISRVGDIGDSMHEFHGLNTAVKATSPRP